MSQHLASLPIANRPNTFFQIDQSAAEDLGTYRWRELAPVGVYTYDENNQPVTLVSLLFGGPSLAVASHANGNPLDYSSGNLLYDGQVVDLGEPTPIRLTNKEETSAYVDAYFASVVNAWRWRAIGLENSVHARVDGQNMTLSRFILAADGNEVVYHANGDKTDNTFMNLYIETKSNVGRTLVDRSSYKRGSGNTMPGKGRPKKQTGNEDMQFLRVGSYILNRDQIGLVDDDEKAESVIVIMTMQDIDRMSGNIRPYKYEFEGTDRQRLLAWLDGEPLPVGTVQPASGTPMDDKRWSLLEGELAECQRTIKQQELIIDTLKRDNERIKERENESSEQLKRIRSMIGA